MELGIPNPLQMVHLQTVVAPAVLILIAPMVIVFVTMGTKKIIRAVNANPVHQTQRDHLVIASVIMGTPKTILQANVNPAPLTPPAHQDIVSVTMDTPKTIQQVNVLLIRKLVS